MKASCLRLPLLSGKLDLRHPHPSQPRRRWCLRLDRAPPPFPLGAKLPGKAPEPRSPAYLRLSLEPELLGRPYLRLILQYSRHKRQTEELVPAYLRLIRKYLRLIRRAMPSGQKREPQVRRDFCLWKRGSRLLQAYRSLVGAGLAPAREGVNPSPYITARQQRKG